jgi:hypothetical protein
MKNFSKEFYKINYKINYKKIIYKNIFHTTTYCIGKIKLAKISENFR